ncbi:Dna Topoisomerase I [Manis pentadactyla]|nr:Dna Topoisomerase I [Manis pentadactyla]
MWAAEPCRAVVQLHPEAAGGQHIVVFNFLVKDSIRYHNGAVEKPERAPWQRPGSGGGSGPRTLPAIKAKEQQVVEAKSPLKKARANQRLLGPQVQKSLGPAGGGPGGSSRNVHIHGVTLQCCLNATLDHLLHRPAVRQLFFVVVFSWLSYNWAYVPASVR